MLYNHELFPTQSFILKLKKLLEYQLDLYEQIAQQGAVSEEEYCSLPQFQVMICADNLTGSNIQINISLMESQLTRSCKILEVAKVRGLYNSKANFKSLKSLLT